MGDLRDFAFHRLREEADCLTEKLSRIESELARERLRGEIEHLKHRIDALMLPVEAKLYSRFRRRFEARAHS